MKGGMNQILRQAQKMQEELARVQEELANITVEGSSGGGMVKVTANCQNQIMEVKVEPEVIDPEDKEMLEDLVAAAVNDAVRQVEKTTEEKMSGLTAGMGLPGGFKLPF